MSHPAAGELNQIVTLMRPVRAQDGSGQMVDGTPMQIAKRWANVQPITGAEKDIADRITAETTHRLTLRSNRSLVIPKTDFVVWRGKRLDIEAVLEFPPDGYVVVLAKEVDWRA